MSPYQDPTSARAYAEKTRDADLSHVRSRFVDHLPERSDGTQQILDLGCGSGRDSLAFRQAGYRVEAIEAYPAMAGVAREYAEVPIRVLRAQELEDRGVYDGIWACASLLHVPWDELPDVFRRLENALRPGGVLYVSFKPGKGERTVGDGRHFTDMTRERLHDRLRNAPGLRLIETWETFDVRPERAGEPWFNALLRRD